MKNLFYILITFLCADSVLAQITLTEAIIPKIGEKYSYTFCDTTNIFQGESGANKTWDFSKLKKLTSPQSVVNFEIVNPATGQGSSNFSTAEYAYLNEGSYGYYKSSSNSIERLGTGYQGGSEVLTDYQIVSKFPFTYNDEFTDVFSGKMTVVQQGQTVNINRAGTITIKADGYGTLITEKGTFDNVLRIKATQKIYDTIPPFMPGLPASYIETETVTYLWQNNEFKFSLLSISFINAKQNIMGQTSNTISKSVSLFDANPPVKQLKTPEIVNPAKDAKDIETPFLLEWTDALSKSLIKFEPNSEIEYTAQVTSDPSWENLDLIKEYKVSGKTSIEVTDKFPSKTLACRVKAKLGDSETEWSEANGFSIKTIKPEKPVLSAPANNTKYKELQDVTLSWANNDKAVKTLLSIEGSFSKLIELNTETSYVLKDLVEGDYINWKLKFINEYGDSSDWSEIWNFQIELSSDVYEANQGLEIKSAYSRNNKILLNLRSEAERIINIKIYDIEGRELNREEFRVSTGDNLIDIDMANKSKSIYLLYFKSEEFEKLIKVTN